MGGTHDEIVKDWWDKMLTALERLGGAQRRAIIRHIPDPLKAILDFRSVRGCYEYFILFYLERL